MVSLFWALCGTPQRAEHIAMGSLRRALDVSKSFEIQRNHENTLISQEFAATHANQRKSDFLIENRSTEIYKKNIKINIFKHKHRKTTENIKNGSKTQKTAENHENFTKTLKNYKTT